MRAAPRNLLPWLVGSLLVGAWLASCRTPPVLDAEEEQAVQAELFSYASKEDLSDHLGAIPQRCVLASYTTEVCQWHLGKRHRGWRALARAALTRDRINLVCELPIDGSPRRAEACSAFPCRTNRSYFANQVKAKPGGHKKDTAAEAQRIAEQERRRRQARLDLDSASNVAALSSVVGAAPEWCEETAPDSRVCLWRASGRTYGHGTLATVSGLSRRKKLHLRCTLPADGSPRELGACSIELGGRAAARAGAG